MLRISCVFMLQNKQSNELDLKSCFDFWWFLVYKTEVI